MSSGPVGENEQNPGGINLLVWKVFTEMGQWKGKRRARRHSGRRRFKMLLKKEKTFPSRRAEPLYLFSLSQLSVILPARAISSSPLARSAATQHVIVSRRKEAASNQEQKPTSRPFFQHESRKKDRRRISATESPVCILFACFFVF